MNEAYFHTTNAAEAILRDGFRDGTGNYGMSITLTGVFIANMPVSVNEGAIGDQVLEVVLPDGTDLDDFEIVEEGKDYREWCVPADLINSQAAVRLLNEDEAEQAWFVQLLGPDNEAHRKLWRRARNLNDLGVFTALWLEGDITHLPAYHGAAPDPETVPLIGRLAAYNRAGLVTTCSQPGEPLEEGRGQRAWISGFCNEPTLDKIRAACLGTDLIVIYTPPYCESSTQVVVTINDHAECTWAGGALDEATIEQFYGQDCPNAIDALSEAWQVDIIDPRWGRNDLLWDRLTQALT